MSHDLHRLQGTRLRRARRRLALGARAGTIVPRRDRPVVDASAWGLLKAGSFAPQGNRPKGNPPRRILIVQPHLDEGPRAQSILRRMKKAAAAFALCETAADRLLRGANVCSLRRPLQQFRPPVDSEGGSALFRELHSGQQTSAGSGYSAAGSSGEFAAAEESASSTGNVLKYPIIISSQV